MIHELSSTRTLGEIDPVLKLAKDIRSLEEALQQVKIQLAELLKRPTASHSNPIYAQPIEVILFSETYPDPRERQWDTRLVEMLRDGKKLNKKDGTKQLAGPCIIQTVADLLRWSETELRAIHNMGPKVMERLKVHLSRANLEIGLLII